MRGVRERWSERVVALSLRAAFSYVRRNLRGATWIRGNTCRTRKVPRSLHVLTRVLGLVGCSPIRGDGWGAAFPRGFWPSPGCRRSNQNLDPAVCRVVGRLPRKAASESGEGSSRSRVGGRGLVLFASWGTWTNRVRTRGNWLRNKSLYPRRTTAVVRCAYSGLRRSVTVRGVRLA